MLFGFCALWCNFTVHTHAMSIDSHLVNYCFKCYAINSHVAKNCSKPESYKVCSICTAEDHTYKDCTSEVKKCLNCDGDHITMSKSCKKIKETSSPSSTMNRTESYKKAVEQNPTDFPANDGLTHDDMFRGYMSLVYASSVNSDKPGSFEENLEKLLLANKLPSFSTAGIKPPNIISHFGNTPCQMNDSERNQNSENHTINDVKKSTENIDHLPLHEMIIAGESLRKSRQPLPSSANETSKTRKSTRSGVKPSQMFVRKGSKRFIKGKNDSTNQ